MPAKGQRVLDAFGPQPAPGEIEKNSFLVWIVLVDRADRQAGALRNAANWRRGDNKWEYPSVFNPYWQSSLVETSTLALTAGDAAQASGAP